MNEKKEIQMQINKLFDQLFLAGNGLSDDTRYLINVLIRYHSNVSATKSRKEMLKALMVQFMEDHLNTEIEEIDDELVKNCVETVQDQQIVSDVTIRTNGKIMK